MARPKKVIDPKAVAMLAGFGCTVEEIASKLDCCKRTLERRFVASMESGRSSARATLRSKQFEIAMSGNVEMLKWCGRHLLGQSERLEIAAVAGFIPIREIIIERPAPAEEEEEELGKPPSYMPRRDD